MAQAGFIMAQAGLCKCKTRLLQSAGPDKHMRTSTSAGMWSSLPHGRPQACSGPVHMA